MQNNNTRLHHFGQAGVTLAAEPAGVHDAYRAVAIAVTHPDDTFTRRRGAMVAAGRLSKKREPSRHWGFVYAEDLRNAIRKARILCQGDLGAEARTLLKQLVYDRAIM